MKLTNKSDDLTEWYRSVLVTRAKHVDGCPTGRLVNRRSTKVTSRVKKLAQDCYTLQQHVNGDSTHIEDVFSGGRTPSKQTSRTDECEIRITKETGTTLDTINIVELCAIVTELRESVKVVNEENNRYRKTIADLKSQMSEMKHQYDMMELDMVKIKANCKLYNDTLKQVQEIDSTAVTRKIKQTETMCTSNKDRVNHLNKKITDLHSKLHNIETSQLTPKHTTISCEMEPPREGMSYTNGPQDNDETTTVDLSTTDIVPQFISTSPERLDLVADTNKLPSEPPGTCNTDSHGHCKSYKTVTMQTASHANMQKVSAAVSNETQTKSTEDVYHTGLRNIPTILQGKVHEHVTQGKNTPNYPTRIPNSSTKQANPVRKVNKDTFIGALRYKTSAYYIGNIGKETTEKGIMDFFKERGVVVTRLHMFQTKAGGISAKLNVPSTFCKFLESEDFTLPDGIVGRSWEQKQRRKYREHQSQGHNIFDNKWHDVDDAYNTEQSKTYPERENGYTANHKWHD